MQQLSGENTGHTYLSGMARLPRMKWASLLFCSLQSTIILPYYTTTLLFHTSLYLSKHTSETIKTITTTDFLGIFINQSIIIIIIHKHLNVKQKAKL